MIPVILAYGVTIPVKASKSDIGDADFPAIALVDIDRYGVRQRSSYIGIRYGAYVTADLI
jgi:hypothetical protein